MHMTLLRSPGKTVYAGLVGLEDLMGRPEVSEREGMIVNWLPIFRKASGMTCETMLRLLPAHTPDLSVPLVSSSH